MTTVFRGRVGALTLASLCLAAAALLLTMFFYPSDIAADPRLTLPPDQPALGLIYDGLEVGTEGNCPGAYRVAGTSFCTHGPDAAPRGLDLGAPVAAVGGPTLAGAVTAAANTPIVCEGDGVSGNRFQVLYVRPQSGADRYAQYLATLRTTVGGVNDILNASAAETGGVRHLRLVTDGNCDVAVTNVTVSDEASVNFGTMVGDLFAQGFNRADRKYIIFMDANTYCGLGTVDQHADRPGSDNPNNFGPSFARVDSGCWVSYALAHEVMHTLGGVLASAPNGTANGHCTDAYDVMCYSDAPGVKLVTACPQNARQDRFDCNHDDYFHTAPPAGSYLATHWNAADNQFLIRTGPAAPVATSPSPSPSPVASVPPSVVPSATPSTAPSTPARSLLTIVPANGGYVSTSSAAPYLLGQVVTLAPKPSSGQVFLGWRIAGPDQRVSDGPVSSWVTPLTLTIEGDTTVTPLFAPRPAFGDVSSADPASEQIAQLAALGIIRGYGNGDFGSNDRTQRAQMAALIVRAMGWGNEDWGNDFVDGGGIDATLWRNVGTLAHYNVTKGYDGVSFGPTDEVSQLQVISFVTRAMVAKGYWTAVTTDTPGLYPNVGTNSGHRFDLLTFHHHAGGIDAGTGPATRGWFAQTLYQALDSIYGH